MGKARKYPKAPITEAIINLHVQPAERTSVADVARCHEGEEGSYPNRKDIQIAKGLIEVGPRVSTAVSAQHVGFMYTSSDQKQVYQVTLDGFSFSRLAPYESWDAFCHEARRLWQIYRERLKPAAVTRQAVRYVNRLDIQALAGYFMQLQIPMDDIQCKLLLNETIGESPKPGCVALILDIDLFREDDIPKDEEGIWQLFEILRVRKNEIFEACITDRARELFK